MTLLVLDLFCGAAGGWSTGLHMAGGFTTVAACEADAWRRDRFLRNFPNVRMYSDVRRLTAKQLAADGCAVDALVGSPPCGDASEANTSGKGVEGARTGLFFDALRIAGELGGAATGPRWVALENVPGIRGRGADRVLHEMEALGYESRSIVVGSRHVGARHIRDRVFFVGNAPLVSAHADEIGRDTGRAKGRQANKGREDPPGPHYAGPFAVAGPRRHARDDGPVFSGRMADGVSEELARDGLAAYGDCVDPRVIRMLGLAILSAEQMISSQSEVPK